MSGCYTLMRCNPTQLNILQLKEVRIRCLLYWWNLLLSIPDLPEYILEEPH